MLTYTSTSSTKEVSVRKDETLLLGICWISVFCKFGMLNSQAGNVDEPLSFGWGLDEEESNVLFS